MDNPLYVERLADNMIEYVTLMQIHAQQSGESITEPHVLRAIDETLVSARSMREEAHAKRDEAKMDGWECGQ